MKKPFYLLSLVVPLSIFISFYYRGPWSYFALIFSFVFLPLLELFLPSVKRLMTEEEEKKRKQEFYFDFILWLNLPIQYGLLIYYLWLLKSGDLSTIEIIGTTTAMGIGCGVMGINAAHELGHRNNFMEQTMAKMLLSTSLYWHFFIEHNKGHHKHVSTPLDAATARLNETLYAFIPRSIIGSFLSAWEIEKTNGKRLGFSTWSLKNEMVRAILIQTSIPLMIGLILGIAPMLGFLASALLGIVLLEMVNYIEHYGLARRETSPGRYEKVQPWHSWNSCHPISRTVLFDLSLHSDHHYNAAKKYQILQNQPEGMELPTGYPGMVILSLLPPLWFKIMNRKIELAQSRIQSTSA